MNTELINLAALIVVIAGALWLLARIGDLLTVLGFDEWLKRREDIQEQKAKELQELHEFCRKNDLLYTWRNFVLPVIVIALIIGLFLGYITYQGTMGW